MEKEKQASNEAALVERFRKNVLTWDYLSICEESNMSNDAKKKKAISVGIKTVKNTYGNMEEYLGVFEPLLFEEVKSQINQSKDDPGVNKAAVVSSEELNDFRQVSVVVDDNFPSVSENDLLLLSKEKFSLDNLPYAYAFAMVQYRSKETIKLLTFSSVDGTKQLDKSEVEFCKRLSNMQKILEINRSIFYIQKLCNLSTIIREYVALHSLGSLPLKNLILSATDKVKDHNIKDQTAWNVSRDLMEVLEDDHNESQLSAIKAGLSRKPFVLIQGPPGTGKTKTILGLLSALLHSIPERVQSLNGSGLKRGIHVYSMEERKNYSIKASPWLFGQNQRYADEKRKLVNGNHGSFPIGGIIPRKPYVINCNRKNRVHVLVCAPSNSALDEIILRVLRTGIYNEFGDIYNPKIVRIGLKPHHSVKTVSMDYLVEQKHANMRNSFTGKESVSDVMDLDRIRSSIIDESAIVFSTLSFSGSSIFAQTNRAFDVVVIDEAAQAVEAATLVPLAHGCKQVFLVGDPFQLPATVISTTAQTFGYGTSLFKRFQNAGYHIHMLTTQYRMHPKIRTFPSKEFYSDSLVDGKGVLHLTKRKWHSYRCFGPFCFFDIDGVESEPSGGVSLMNKDEVDFIVEMYYNLSVHYPELKSSTEIAVISPYSHQVKVLKENFQENFGQCFNQIVDINTVDGFQGRERDIAIFSCVRSNSDKGIGFVSDFRRMNVGITRAKSSVLVVGSASTLIQDKHWKNLINYAKIEDSYFQISKPYKSFFDMNNLNKLKREDLKVSAIVDGDLELGNLPINAPIQDGMEVDDMDFGGDYE